jgi:hypothetical protein
MIIYHFKDYWKRSLLNVTKAKLHACPQRVNSGYSTGKFQFAAVDFFRDTIAVIIEASNGMYLKTVPNSFRRDGLSRSHCFHSPFIEPISSSSCTNQPINGSSPHLTATFLKIHPYVEHLRLITSFQVSEPKVRVREHTSSAHACRYGPSMPCLLLWP